MTGLWADGGPYQAWVDHLRRWAALEPVDPAALPPLTQEQFDADTWARLTAHLTGALTARLVAWADAMVRALAQAHDEFSYGRELAQARTGLHTVRALAAHPGLPASLRERLTALVDEQIPQVQAQLERGLEEEARRGTDPRRVEARRRTLRDNALTATLGAPPPPAPGQPWAYDPAAPPRRRILPG
ncbi:hypothetical protein [Streptomyces mangrovisoli]|uniref:Uncharacterized protein n=1 Tax=Streptomyces mangrovisoli TaxID=1428628 RepID=A0A1J4NST8_9ACTN|nr:hypothetical protein [Streptomyces mangrovisoli]OIJ65162.1 hypothetical protein WN71_025485 [Streptomyces mangrovisoli]